MQNKWICFFTAAFLLINLHSTKVLAAVSDSEELSYDDLVSELSEKREKSQKKNATRGPVQSHLGLGILNSYNEISEHGETSQASSSGFAISTGMDLNSELVRGELEFRNYSSMGSGSQSGTMREFAGGLHFRRPVSDRWQMKFGGGLALRMLNFSDTSKGIDVDDTSSMFHLGAGVEAKLSQTVALGGGLTTHFPFGTATSDRRSVDMGVKLDTSF